MKLSRVFLLLVGAVFVAFGIWGLFDPIGVTAMSEVTLGTPAARADGWAVYGGLTTGLGIFLMLAGSRPSLVEAGLWVIALSVGAAAMGRALGVVLHSARGAAVFPTLVFELLLTSLAITALIRERRTAS